MQHTAESPQNIGNETVDCGVVIRLNFHFCRLKISRKSEIMGRAMPWAGTMPDVTEEEADTGVVVRLGIAGAARTCDELVTFLQQLQVGGRSRFQVECAMRALCDELAASV